MLQIAKDEALTDIVSSDKNSVTDNPITTQHPIEGSTEEVDVWLFNDDETRRYENVEIFPVDVEGTDESSWIELADDDGEFGSSVTIPEINDANIGRRIRVRVTAPEVSNVENKVDLRIRITATEFAV